MAEHANAKVVRLGYQKFEEGDIDGFMALLSDDVVFHIPGRNATSGDYTGKEQLGEFFGKLNELTGGQTAIEIHSVTASDDGHAVALIRIESSREGKGTFAQNYAHVFHIDGGKITEMWEMPVDQHAEDEFYS